jgi:hypothetical protein
MKSALLIAVLLASGAGVAGSQAAPAAAVANTWTRVSPEGEYPVQYLDVRHVSRTGQTGSIWSLQDSGPSVLLRKYKPFLSTKYLIEYDCTRPVHRTLLYAKYSGHMGQGTVTDSDPRPEDWIPNPPNAPIVAQGMTLACGAAPAR